MVMVRKIDVKPDVSAIKKIIDDTNKKQGVEALYLGSKEPLEIARVSTGIPDLDYVLGENGLPQQRIIQVYGPESSGKTSLVYHIMSKYEMSCFIDAEKTYSRKFAESCGVQSNRVIQHKPVTLEETLEVARRMIEEAHMPLVVIDSIPGVVSKVEYEEEDMEKEVQRARLASLLSRKLPILNSLCYRYGSTLLLINQIRDNQKAMMYGDSTALPGGHALKHFNSVTLKVARKDWLKVSDEKLGIEMRVVCTKNKTSNPQRECILYLIFGKGFVSAEEKDTVLKQVRKDMLKERKEMNEEKAS